VELRDASHLWGKTVWETEGRSSPNIRTRNCACPASAAPGENGVLYAAIVNDLHRAAGRSGVGAVAGRRI
jgi:aldehyde:ferredoxin oxidoreductase